MKAAVVAPGRILHVAGDVLYAQSGKWLKVSTDYGETWCVRGVLPSRALGWSRWCRPLQRLLRRGGHDLVAMEDGALIVVVNGAILRYDPGQRECCVTHEIQHGTRPLCLCATIDGSLFWGEYFGNAERMEVLILGSEDGGRTFEAAYQFPRGTIRHVHGVFEDPDTGEIWVTTGDRDEESCLWVTSDRFRTIEKVAGGNQQRRAIRLLFTSSHVYFGSDTPEEENHIYRLEKASGRTEQLQSVGESVFHGCSSGGYLFFSTAIEPSRANTGREAIIWGSANGDEWDRLWGYRKDRLPAKLFQYGQVVFPSGRNTTGCLFYTPIAASGDMLMWRCELTEPENSFCRREPSDV